MAERTTAPSKEQTEAGAAERTRQGMAFTPRVDIYETDKELLLLADMPGVNPDDVDLRYENGELVLHGRVKPRTREGSPLIREYEEGDFYRVFTIHESVDSSRIDASCRNGVLTIHLPKAEAAQPRQVKVRGGA